jgi:hypothetical protein
VTYADGRGDAGTAAPLSGMTREGGVAADESALAASGPHRAADTHGFWSPRND